MAREVILRCDNPGGKPCLRQAIAWRIWPEGAPSAYRVDLCEVHAKPLRALMEGAEEEPLPTKQRQTLQVTRLKPTKATRALKK